MKYWEFLIQKEGDQTWLPLETQQVEILEGRYRVVAHTDRANAPINIQVSQLVTDEMPPRNRVRRRTGSTNESGLVVVMPFVHLQPGQWKLKCTSADGVGDGSGAAWEYAVQLQVFAQSEEDWSSEWPVPQDDRLTPHELTDKADLDEPNLTDNLAGDFANDLINADLPLLQAQAELRRQRNFDANSADFDDSSAQLEISARPVYQVMLKQQAYLSQRGRPMTIMGKVRASDTSMDGGTSHLWIRLQNPQTAGVIMEAHRPLSLARLPADFKVQVQLPDEVKTRVVLGEVSLRRANVEGARPAEVLASTAFTITAGIDQILDAIANQDAGLFEEEVSMLSGMSGDRLEPTQEPSVPLFESAEPKATTPVENSVLPPQLGKRVEEASLAEPIDELPARLGSSLIDLPSFGQTTFDPSASDLAASDPSASELLDSELLDSEQLDSKQPSEQAVADRDSVQASLTELNPPADRQPTNITTSASPVISNEAKTATNGLFTREIAGSSQEASNANNAFDRPAVEPVSLPPMVSAPAQFVGTSIEDSDLEADEIAAVLDDIDSELLDEPSELDALEAPGIEGVVESMSQDLPQTSSAADVKLANARPADARFADARFADAESADTVESPSVASATTSSAATSARRTARKSGREIGANVAFQSLKMKDHFWQRLSALNRQGHQEAAKLAEDIEAAGVSRGDGFSALAPASSALEGYSDEEVVIYDEPIESEDRLQGTALRQASKRRYGDPQARLNALRSESVQMAAVPPSDASVAEGMNTVSEERADAPRIANVSSDDLPEMALPVISLPAGDLVAGQTVTVAVRSRPSTYKPFIKLWMVDRQSRSLVVEPKILTNLMLDALGDLQGTVEMVVPMDCLDVQIAAIAIDMATQQESGKAVVNRRVVPPNQTRALGRFNL